MRLNNHQRKIQEVINREKKAGKPIRIVILKPRQTGITTLGSANLFHQTRFHGGTSMVVSKDMDSSEHIFGIIQRFHHYLPKEEREVLKPLASNRKELKFEEPHGGRILIETAGKTTAGHSFTLRNLLLSEVSRWPEGCEDTITGLLAAVPNEPDTMIIIESVANGMQGWFWQKWQEEGSDYVKIFLPWYEHDEYRQRLPIPEDSFQVTFSDEEKILVTNYSLGLEQVEWRRGAVRNICRGSRDKFKEQFPATDREAFLTTGNSFFDNNALDAIKVSEPLRCELRVFETLGSAEETRPVPLTNGRLRLWKKPQPNRNYVIGVDVAEGVETTEAPQDDKHDYSSADVLDRATGEQVAQLHSQMTPDEKGKYLALLGRYYNNAFIGVEANAGYGLYVIDVLRQEDYPEALLYRRQILDEVTRRPTRKLGWITTRANRRSMMAALDMAIRNGEVLINCAETIMELRAFIVKADGRIEAGAGNKDDRVFSLAIAYQMLASAPAAQSVFASDRDRPALHPVKYRESPLFPRRKESHHSVMFK